MEVEDEEAAVQRVRQLECEEPLLQENPNRFVMFPIKHPDIWKFYKKAEGKCWKKGGQGKEGGGVMKECHCTSAVYTPRARVIQVPVLAPFMPD